ncbi:hypothetical protein GGR50DRAFT_690001 [Xylaria sp. CBS 124048]|nr:hypothetical protein GGR50DRAFT_690001 [Xylaria sp. CBS 124048]
MPTSSRRNQAQQPNSPWQERLEEVCREYQIQPPDYQLVSDRRGNLWHVLTSLLGGRTAWSSVVTICGNRIEARYWYDGNNLNNAKEDAAEAALQWLTSNSGVNSTW